jgi:hypothetical protein
MSQDISSAAARSPVRLAFIGGLLIGAPAILAAQTQPASQTPPPSVEQSWDSLLQGAAAPQAPPDPALNAPQAQEQGSAGDFANHFFFESRMQYWRYNTQFTGRSTITGILNTPNTGAFNPNGFPFPQVFQPDADRASALIDWGTRGWISDRVNTHFTLLYAQDLSRVNSGAPAENIIETFHGNRRFEFLQASIEITGKPTDGGWGGTSLQLGRLNVYGAELAQLDGGSFTVDRSKFTLTVFGGRRFSYYSDPNQRLIGGANINFKFTPNTSFEYEGLWYIRGSNSAIFRHRFTRAWLWSSYFRAYGSSPVDFSTQVFYSSRNGKTGLRLSYFQKLTNKDYFYDYTYQAKDLDKYNKLLRLYLGPLAPYSQFVIDARRSLTRSFRLGGSVWIRRLNDTKDQGPFDTSFEDYRVHTQFFPLRKTETFIEYHQRNSDRLSPLNPTSFVDVSHSGETKVQDMTGELRRGFGEGRFTLHGGVYYRRISLQDQFFIITGEHQSGWLAGAWWRVDQHARISFDYSLDNDFFLFRPDLKNSRILQVGLTWRY